MLCPASHVTGCLQFPYKMEAGEPTAIAPVPFILTIAPAMVSAISFDSPTLQRAERAIRCAPFRLKLLRDLRQHSVALNALVDDDGIHNGYTRRPLSELTAENEMMWLLAVGLLRREVDGQGLTDSFRLTPLGRQLLDRWDDQAVTDRPPGIRDHLYNLWHRWLRSPSWF